ncbi:PilZ domain-containing protein [Pseudomonas sp. UBA6562]|uniref:PilZ domain-containing protein n=1 Tax=Pseudomonas sp. UBA6562 TaxID=1947332 RepID=UPI0025D42E5C|nr:PilZ domain-containing protein [Pseudomonas sp. UBA6562]
MGDSRERRRFQRIPFDAATQLCQHGQCWPVALIDLSLKGLLIERPAAWPVDLTQPFEARVQLGADVLVRMQVELRHEEAGRLGFACTSMDIDSISHLHRLVELNLADETEMQRELGELIED